MKRWLEFLFFLVLGGGVFFAIPFNAALAVFWITESQWAGVATGAAMFWGIVVLVWARAGEAG